MYQITIVYNHPTDTAAFDDHYEHTHVPLVRAIPDVRAFELSKCESLDASRPAAYAIARLSFDDKESAGQAFGSPAGQAAAGDVAGFASGGATMFFTEQTAIDL